MPLNTLVVLMLQQVFFPYTLLNLRIEFHNQGKLYRTIDKSKALKKNICLYKHFSQYPKYYGNQLMNLDCLLDNHLASCFAECFLHILNGLVVVTCIWFCICITRLVRAKIILMHVLIITLKINIIL